MAKYPVNGPITSGYGVQRPGHKHTGIDLGGKMGAPINVPYAGKVVFAGPRGAYGNFVIVDHGDGVLSRYGHLKGFNNLKVGQQLNAGDVLGYVGNTGRSTGPHTHYEIVKNGQFLNPTNYAWPSAAPIPMARMGVWDNTGMNTNPMGDALAGGAGMQSPVMQGEAIAQAVPEPAPAPQPVPKPGPGDINIPNGKEGIWEPMMQAPQPALANNPQGGQQMPLPLLPVLAGLASAAGGAGAAGGAAGLGTLAGIGAAGAGGTALAGAGAGAGLFGKLSRGLGMLQQAKGLLGGGGQQQEPGYQPIQVGGGMAPMPDIQLQPRQMQMAQMVGGGVDPQMGMMGGAPRMPVRNPLQMMISNLMAGNRFG